MSSVETSIESVTYMGRLGLPQFAHLRAVALGLSPLESAERYLGAETRHAALRLHNALVDRARAVARQAGYRQWRLIGLSVRTDGAPTATPPSIDDWAEAHGLAGWSQAELMESYTAAFPVDRKQARNARLRERQLALVNRLEHEKLSRAKVSDPVEDWFDRKTSHRLASGLDGDPSLGALQRRIACNRSWWRGFARIGRKGAARIEAYLASLLPRLPVTVPAWQVALASLDRSDVPRLKGSPQRYGGGPPTIAATNDSEAIEAFIESRANPNTTALDYQKELRRYQLWCVASRDKAMSATMVEDCNAYKAFLEDIPDEWKRGMVPVAEGAHWAPFNKPISPQSQRQALNILRACFHWLCQVRYLSANPWDAINITVGASKEEAKAKIHTRAFSRRAWEALLRSLEKRELAEVADDAHRRRELCDALELGVDKFYSVRMRHFACKGNEASLRLPEWPAKQLTREQRIAVEKQLAHLGWGELATVCADKKNASRPLMTDERALLRARFVFSFMGATGLRSAELLDANLGDISYREGSWFIAVVGKGEKARLVPLPPLAIRALEVYLAHRSLPSIDHCVVDRRLATLPVLASVKDLCSRVTYSAFYQSVKAALKVLAKKSSMNEIERQEVTSASPHWLRHTFGTRSIERGVSDGVLMQVFGHADKRPTARYSRAQEDQMTEELDKAFS